jgi:hypothetical protein
VKARLPKNRKRAFLFLERARLARPNGSNGRKDRRGETTVSEKTGTNEVTAKAAGLGISLDAWAVALALGLALLVWMGWIKHVSW